VVNPLRTASSLALVLAGTAACVHRGAALAPLVIVPDSSVYHYAPEPREPGTYRVILTVHLRNRSADTVHLGGPCNSGGRPAHWFLAADSEEEAALYVWGCIGAVARPKDAPDPAYFAIPPHAERTHTVWVHARPRLRPTPPTIPWALYAGDFRIAYQRMQRRGWPRARWHALPRSESVSGPFRLVVPDS